MQDKWFGRIRQILVLIIVAGLALCSFASPGRTTSQTSPQGFTSEPILRIETGMHTASILRIGVDSRERFLVSGSDDKSVRIWDIETGRLIRTLQVPQGKNNTGWVYSVAISPDGDSVAVGGWTGFSDLEQFIFIYDRQTGEIRHVISGLPNVIHHLAYSPDGAHLAATLGSNGLRIYETRNYTSKAKDEDYGASSYWADFDAAGRLATTCYDGYVRLYDKNFRLRLKKKAPGGKLPFGVSFSPDSGKLAVGYADSGRVDLLSAKSLELDFSANTSDVANGTLSTVAWSKDGGFLYAAGTYYLGSLSPIRRWSRGGREKSTDLKLAQSTVMGLIALSKGRLALGAQDPLLALFSADGQPVWNQAGEIADFKGQLGNEGIRLSKSGDTVQFGYEQWGKKVARFSLKNSQLELDPSSAGTLSEPVTQAPGVEITNWRNEHTPNLNGTPIKLDEFENSRSLAIAPDHEHFLLGTDWKLRLFDRTGKSTWVVDFPGAAWAVNISGDGRVAVAGFSDGTLRWYRMTDGKELLALFAHRDGRRWVAWTPQGYYQASAGAEDLIGWHINHGSQKAPDFFGASRFREQFYRPDVLARVFETLDVEKALALADKERGTKTVSVEVKSVLPPTIKILSPASGEKTKSNTLTLLYSAESSTGPITDVQARVDGRPAQVRNHVCDQSPGKNVGQLTIEIPAKDAMVSLIAVNQHGSSEPASFYSNWAGAKDWYKPNLYVLAVGVSDYELPQLNLKYAHKDAQDFVRAVKSQEGGLYKKVEVRLLISKDGVKDATRDGILDGLDWLRRETTGRDVAMVFLSGHGTNDSRGNYNFLPSDADPAKLARTCIDKNDFIKFLSEVPGKTIFFFDSCRSGNVQVGVKAGEQAPNVEKFAGELADADSGVIVFSSSTGKQFSLEKDELQNGAFTKALLEGFEGQADYLKDWFVSVAELETYVPERVKQLTKGEQKPVSTKPKAVEDFKIMQVSQGSSGG